MANHALPAPQIPRYSPGPKPAPSLPTPSGSSPTPSAQLPARLLVVGGDEALSSCVPGLRHRFRVSQATTLADALAAIERERPEFIVADLSLPDGGAVSVCTAARRFDPPASVLVITQDPAAVPDVLAVGCDAVLLKPFAPNLLYVRMGRMVRERQVHLRATTRRDGRSSAGGTNRVWPGERCPNCQALGITSFEFHSHRRAWFACTACRKVWIGARLEEF